MRAPFTYYGAKSVVAPVIWRRFGAVQNFVEPFFGSGAVLLARPDWQPGMTETVNDIDGLLTNAWRSIQFDPETTAHYAYWPVSEACLCARHAWLVGQREDITARLMGDPEWFDPKAAGYWIWGICSWIGGGWCSGEGPWQSVDGVLVNGAQKGNGIKRQRPHLGYRQGIHRKRPCLAGKWGNSGKGIHHSANLHAGRGVAIRQWFSALSHRLEGVRICCGDWRRVLGSLPTVYLGTTAILLDPPYSVADREDCYSHDSRTVAAEVRQWAVEHGGDPRLRLALCGYADEHDMPADWTVYRWKTPGGYGNQSNGQGRINSKRECIWFSPHCIPDHHVQQTILWDDETVAPEATA